MTLQVPPGTDSATTTATFDAEFHLEPLVALRWIDSILSRCGKELLPQDVVYLLHCRASLAGVLPPMDRLQEEAPHPICDGLARTGVQQIAQHERARAIAAASAGYASKVPTAGRLLDELWSAAFAPTNLLGTASSGALLLDAAFHSLPVTWHVRLQGGNWELYDANKIARKHAFGNAGKARYPVRMMLRAKGARLSWLKAFRATSKGAITAAPGAKSLPQALRIARGSTLKLISKTAYSALPLRGILGSNAVGFAITVGPQMYVDARDTGLFSHFADQASWKQFAIKSAGSQSGNMAGIAAGMMAGALLATTALGAPLVILIGFGVGIGGQALFNAFGLNEDVEHAARSLFQD